MKLNCNETRAHLSALLADALPRIRQRSVRAHIRHCGHCEAELAGLKRMQDSLRELGEVSVPDDLALRLRVAISREAAKPSVRTLLRDRIELWWKNSARPRALQWSAGLASSLAVMALVALMVGMFAAPSVQASDQPVGLATPPRLLYSAFGPGVLASPQDQAVIVQVSVDREGRVYDYKVLAGDLDSAARAQLENTLYFSVFQPARVFGEAVPGQMVMSFAGVAVHG